MTAYRKATVAVVGTTPFLLTALIPATANAHGAPTDPVSRAVACTPESGPSARSQACGAATAARGDRPFTQWDNVRVAKVRGRDREVIPDGKLCSAGIDAYTGLDLPRADWPTTRLTSGHAFTLTYRSTIPHRGTFKLFITKDSYDPKRPLRWSDLETQPFATATDPKLTNGSYQIKARLPSNRRGHHVLYTIWQNSDTPDTYYSCSDLTVVAPEGAGKDARRGTDPSAEKDKDPEVGGDSRAPGSPEAAHQREAQSRDSPPQREERGDSHPGHDGQRDAGTSLPGPMPAGSDRDSGSHTLPLALATSATILIAATGVAVATLRRRRT